MSDKKEISVTEQIANIKAEICDKICKYPSECHSQIEMDKKCSNCILGNL